MRASDMELGEMPVFRVVNIRAEISSAFSALRMDVVSLVVLAFLPPFPAARTAQPKDIVLKRHQGQAIAFGATNGNARVMYRESGEFKIGFVNKAFHRVHVFSSNRSINPDKWAFHAS
jgi:hypothetical protein